MADFPLLPYAGGRLAARPQEGITMDTTGITTWRKSSYSGTGGGACVEVADGIPGLAPVRDSKDPSGPALLFRAPAWQAFVTAVRTGEFDAR
ncbi:DUF397 domain-containing protein [Kitasatospora sp. NPDC036755]|uniref:DUF397 domain-containing protein n=1 Tax=Kitasatospora sp. NPDC036755 TaxID=3154600 RepID=UPI0033F65E0C